MSNCLFCKIIKGEIPSTKLYEDDEMLAFLDIQPAAPVHFLIVPKKHIENIFETDKVDEGLLGRMMFKAQELLKSPPEGSPIGAGCSEKGGRFVINAKSDGGQTVNHLHIHCMGGRALGWPPG